MESIYDILAQIETKFSESRTLIFTLRAKLLSLGSNNTSSEIDEVAGTMLEAIDMFQPFLAEQRAKRRAQETSSNIHQKAHMPSSSTPHPRRVNSQLSQSRLPATSDATEVIRTPQQQAARSTPHSVLTLNEMSKWRSDAKALAFLDSVQKTFSGRKRAARSAAPSTSIGLRQDEPESPCLLRPRMHSKKSAESVDGEPSAKRRRESTEHGNHDIENSLGRRTSLCNTSQSSILPPFPKLTSMTADEIAKQRDWSIGSTMPPTPVLDSTPGRRFQRLGKRASVLDVSWSSLSDPEDHSRPYTPATEPKADSVAEHPSWCKDPDSQTDLKLRDVGNVSTISNASLEQLWRELESRPIQSRFGGRASLKPPPKSPKDTGKEAASTVQSSCPKSSGPVTQSKSRTVGNVRFDLDSKKSPCELKRPVG